MSGCGAPVAGHGIRRVAVLADDPQEGRLVEGVVVEGAAVVTRDDRRLAICLAGHDRGQGGRVLAPRVGVVGQAPAHEQRAQVGVADAQRPEPVGVLLDLGRRVGGVVDQDLLGRDGHPAGESVGLDIELAVLAHELHEVHGGQVAGRVVQEHVFRARVAGIDAVADRARVPVVDGRVVLDARVTAQPGGLRHLAEHGPRRQRVDHLAGGHLAGGPDAVRSTACMNSSVTRTEWLAFWKNTEPYASPVKDAS